MAYDKRAYMRQWNIKNKEKVKAYKKARYKRLKDTGYFLAQARRYSWQRRLKVLELYGGECVCCSESRPEFLTLDHVNGGGKQHRNLFRGGDTYLLSLLKEKREDIRILCANCHLAYTYRGYCPHGEDVLKPKTIKDCLRRGKADV